MPRRRNPPAAACAPAPAVLEDGRENFGFGECDSLPPPALYSSSSGGRVNNDDDEDDPDIKYRNDKVTQETLNSLIERYELDTTLYSYRVPNPDEYSSRGNPGEIAVYSMAVEYGLRFPVHAFFRYFLCRVGLSPAQLSPNGWRHLIAFKCLCRKYNVPARFPVLQHVAKLCRLGGFYYLWQKSEHRLFEGFKDSISGFKNEFFFVKRKRGKWGFSEAFVKPDCLQFNTEPALDESDSAILKLLVSGSGNNKFNVGDLVTESSLRSAFLSFPPDQVEKAETEHDSLMARLCNDKGEDTIHVAVAGTSCPKDSTEGTEEDMSLPESPEEDAESFTFLPQGGLVESDHEAGSPPLFSMLGQKRKACVPSVAEDVTDEENQVVRKRPANENNPGSSQEECGIASVASVPQVAMTPRAWVSLTTLPAKDLGRQGSEVMAEMISRLEALEAEVHRSREHSTKYSKLYHKSEEEKKELEKRIRSLEVDKEELTSQLKATIVERDEAKSLASAHLNDLAEVERILAELQSAFKGARSKVTGTPLSLPSN